MQTQPSLIQRFRALPTWAQLVIALGGLTAIHSGLQTVGLIAPSPPQPIAATPSPTTPAVQCTTAGGNLYTGVQLYLDSNCTKPLAIVKGGRSNHKWSDGTTSAAVVIQYPTNFEFKKREAIAQKTWILTNDPAIQAGQWQTY